MLSIHCIASELQINVFKGFKTAIIRSARSIFLGTRRRYEALLKAVMLADRSDPYKKEFVNPPSDYVSGVRIMKEKRFRVISTEIYRAESSIRKIYLDGGQRFDSFLG